MVTRNELINNPTFSLVDHFPSEIMDEEWEMYEFIDAQKAKATKDSTNFAMKTFRRYVTGDPALMAPSCLNRELGKFIMNVTKLNGEVYEPDSLKTLHCGIQRFSTKTGEDSIF